MAMSFNFFHALADISHTASKLILIWAIHNNRSAEGVSLLTQLLYVFVFSTRYIDIFTTNPFHDGLTVWNTSLKIVYITTSAYVVFLMMRVFARTREKEYGWKLATWSLVGSLAAAPVVLWLFEGWGYFTLIELLWTFSVILEAVCILPQLLLLRQTNVPTVFDSYYLVALGVYRALYVVNWIIVIAKGDHRPELPTSIVFGIIQTALYLDFAWVYYSRQRVKLRGGGLVDSEDLSKSFIVNRFIGRRNRTGDNSTDHDDLDDDAALENQENGVIRPSGRSWGPRGISVSADDDTLATENARTGTREGAIMDPSHFEDDDFDDDADAPPPPAKDDPKPTPARPVDTVESSAGEWQDDGGATAPR
ncbi:uncharacterized protein K489DRAFT_378082 [Dissoconium aciculare CBS 342.82]|uniref:ER lumen protein retaining receptor n=1 Tax=Dissoconium aciculare CBS 342.82 TaxID=1314786 RepID=A0A6J3MBZ3_9PEZI|nr:uncharacterized protein K489DRAFT_378082 [Dissoconium aciculare CBS 342.82]KAF1825541.1 hypothetical protein K489DRAFT_378082 [Dissoconium aciculare CBS 342.82]